MVTQKDKYSCPVCGEMISRQGIAGHNRSKKHLAALAEQNAKNEPHEPPNEQQEQIDKTLGGDETGTTGTDTGTERDEPFRFFQ
jgi:hypothetical protein